MKKLIVAGILVAMLAVLFCGCLGQHENPNASINITPSGIINTGQFVVFSGNGSNAPSGSIKNYSWDFGDQSTGVGQWVIHTYSQGGIKTVKLIVVDDGGYTGSASTSVSVNTVPTANAILSPNPKTYTNVTGNFYSPTQIIKFDGSTSFDPDVGDTLTYLWNFGDSWHSLNNTNNAKISYHQFTVGGNYSVSLKVSDGHANSTWGTKITIQDIKFTEYNFTYYKDQFGYRFVNFTTKMRNDGEPGKADRPANTLTIMVETFGPTGTPIPNGMKKLNNSAPLYGGYTYNLLSSLNDIPISLSTETYVRASIYWSNILMDQVTYGIPP